MKKVILILGLIIGFIGFTGCSGAEKIVVGASPSPHAEILQIIKSDLKKEGYKLVIKKFDDYILPNLSVHEEQLDANFFQHEPYLNSFNSENQTDLVSLGGIHYEPLGIYAGTSKTLDLPVNSKVLLPNDVTNCARALLLLEANGLITLKADAGIYATEKDIISNERNLNIVLMEAALIPNALKDNSVAIGVINGNYAMVNGIKISEALAIETSDSLAATTYVNIVAVRRTTADSLKSKALIKALQSEKVKNYIEATYSGAVVPLFV